MIFDYKYFYNQGYRECGHNESCPYRPGSRAYSAYADGYVSAAIDRENTMRIHVRPEIK